MSKPTPPQLFPALRILVDDLIAEDKDKCDVSKSFAWESARDVLSVEAGGPEELELALKRYQEGIGL